MYTANVPSYEIDLNQEEADRWTEVIKAECRIAKKLAKEAAADIPAYVKWFGPIVKSLYQLSGGRYVDEIAAWASAIGGTAADATLLNCSYELSHASHFSPKWFLPFGCTAGARWVPGHGMVHVRSMDWHLATIGDATRIFRFKKGRHDFVTVGVPGLVGVLSGMVPKRYSVTINWAPPDGRPTFDFGPTFLLREVLETCETYEAAVYSLKHTRLSSPVFFLVCGSARGQACVIERTHSESAVRKMNGPVITQANHHVTRKFAKQNQNIEYEIYEDSPTTFLDDSQQRAATLTNSLERIKQAASLDDVATALDDDPVCNADSYQQMVFCPRSGELKVWRWTTK